MTLDYAFEASPNRPRPGRFERRHSSSSLRSLARFPPTLNLLDLGDNSRTLSLYSLSDSSESTLTANSPSPTANSPSPTSSHFSFGSDISFTDVGRSGNDGDDSDSEYIDSAKLPPRWSDNDDAGSAISGVASSPEEDQLLSSTPVIRDRQIDQETVSLKKTVTGGSIPRLPSAMRPVPDSLHNFTIMDSIREENTRYLPIWPPYPDDSGEGPAGKATIEPFEGRRLPRRSRANLICIKKTAKPPHNDSQSSRERNSESDRSTTQVPLSLSNVATSHIGDTDSILESPHRADILTASLLGSSATVHTIPSMEQVIPVGSTTDIEVCFESNLGKTIHQGTEFPPPSERYSRRISRAATPEEGEQNRRKLNALAIMQGKAGKYHAATPTSKRSYNFEDHNDVPGLEIASEEDRVDSMVSRYLQEVLGRQRQQLALYRRNVTGLGVSDIGAALTGNSDILAFEQRAGGRLHRSRIFEPHAVRAKAPVTSAVDASNSKGSTRLSAHSPSQTAETTSHGNVSHSINSAHNSTGDVICRRPFRSIEPIIVKTDRTQVTTKHGGPSSLPKNTGGRPVLNYAPSLQRRSSSVATLPVFPVEDSGGEIEQICYCTNAVDCAGRICGVRRETLRPRRNGFEERRATGPESGQTTKLTNIEVISEENTDPKPHSLDLPEPPVSSCRRTREVRDGTSGFRDCLRSVSNLFSRTTRETARTRSTATHDPSDWQPKIFAKGLFKATPLQFYKDSKSRFCRRKRSVTSRAEPTGSDQTTKMEATEMKRHPLSNAPHHDRQSSKGRDRFSRVNPRRYDGLLQVFARAKTSARESREPADDRRGEKVAERKPRSRLRKKIPGAMA